MDTSHGTTNDTQKNDAAHVKRRNFGTVISSKFSREIISYLFFGVATTLVNWVIYAFAVQIVRLPMAAGNVIAWVFAVMFAFVTNKMWVFQSRSWKPALVLSEAGLFLNARIVTGLIEIIGVPLLFYIGLNYPLLGIEGFAAKMAISVIVVALNYIFSKMFIFPASRA